MVELFLMNEKSLIMTSFVAKNFKILRVVCKFGLDFLFRLNQAVGVKPQNSRSAPNECKIQMEICLGIYIDFLRRF